MSLDLTPDEINRLPDKLRMHYWAGLVGEAAMSAVTQEGAARRCREWLVFADGLAPGVRAVVDSPGHALDGKKVTVGAVDRDCNIAGEGVPPMRVEIVFVEHPSLPEPIGLGPQRLRPVEGIAR